MTATFKLCVCDLHRDEVGDENPVGSRKRGRGENVSYDHLGRGTTKMLF